MSRAISQTDRYREQNQCYLLTDSEHVLSHRHDLTLYCAHILQKQNCSQSRGSVYTDEVAVS